MRTAQCHYVSARACIIIICLRNDVKQNGGKEDTTAEDFILKFIFIHEMKTLTEAINCSLSFLDIPLTFRVHFNANKPKSFLENRVQVSSVFI